MNTAEGSLVQLRAYITQGEFNLNDKLPSERKLCELLGVSRSELRKAFDILESEGVIWRHVGRGTFIGNNEKNDHGASIISIAQNTTPKDVMQARLLLEPMLAREAALHATGQQMEAMQMTVLKTHKAKTWREYETLDNQFHRLFAEATQNNVLLAMFDQLNSLRRAVVWGRLRERAEQPPKDHHSFEEHAAILKSIEHRDGDLAYKLMRLHLTSVKARLFS